MFNSFIAGLRTAASNTDLPETQRRHPRRASDRCVIVVENQTFPVENWSFGGALMNADERLFSESQMVAATLKFKLRNTILDIPVKGNVVRRNMGRIAIAFEPLDRAIRRTFQQVIDDAIASEFAGSQV